MRVADAVPSDMSWPKVTWKAIVTRAAWPKVTWQARCYLKEIVDMHHSRVKGKWPTSMDKNIRIISTAHITNQQARIS